MGKIAKILKSVKDTAVREGNETAVASKIVAKFVREGEITEEEKEFLKNQSIDLAKLVSIVASQAIPVPALTPALIILGKKIGIDLLPKGQEIPEEYKKKKDDTTTAYRDWETSKVS